MSIERSRAEQMLIVIVRILRLNVFEMDNQPAVWVKDPEMVPAAI